MFEIFKVIRLDWQWGLIVILHENKSVCYIDPKGLNTYRVNRDLGRMKLEVGVIYKNGIVGHNCKTESAILIDAANALENGWIY